MHNGNEIIKLATNVKKNVFDSVVLQIYNANTEEFLGNIKTISEKGEFSGVYSHHLPTGNYRFVLKADSTIADEGVSFDADLTEGNGYYYWFRVRSIKDKECIIKNLCIYSETD